MVDDGDSFSVSTHVFRGSALNWRHFDQEPVYQSDNYFLINLIIVSSFEEFTTNSPKLKHFLFAFRNSGQLIGSSVFDHFALKRKTLKHLISYHHSQFIFPETINQFINSSFRLQSAVWFLMVTLGRLTCKEVK